MDYRLVCLKVHRLVCLMVYRPVYSKVYRPVYLSYFFYRPVCLKEVPAGLSW